MKININKLKKLASELRKKNISNLDISKGLEDINDFEYHTELNRLLKQKHNSIKDIICSDTL